MLKQRQVATLFDLFVRLVGAGRYLLAALPVVVVLAATIAAVQPLRQSDEPSLVALGEEPELGAPAPLGDARGAAAVRPRLTAEQSNIARFVASKYRRVSPHDAEHVVALAYQAARDLRLDPMLVLAVISVESSFNSRAQSNRGAQGLMQVLTRVHADKFEPFGGAAAAFDPVANIKVGTRILKEYLVREGSIEGALKSYVGAGTLSHDFGYGHKVLSERERIAAAAQGRPIPSLPARPPAATARQADPAGEPDTAAADRILLPPGEHAARQFVDPLPSAGQQLGALRIDGASPI